MKQELTITVDVPEGYKAYWDGEKVVTVEDVRLPKTWKEFCQQHPLDPELNHFVDESGCPVLHLLPDEAGSRQIVAMTKLLQLRNCYRQGWIPNWNAEEIKYVIFEKYEASYEINEQRFLRGFLAFQSKEIAELFLTNFHELIEEAGDLI